MVLLATALTLTLCFGIAAWRASADNAFDVTGTIPHQGYEWKPRPND